MPAKKPEQVLNSLQMFLSHNPNFWGDFQELCREQGKRSGYVIVRRALDDLRLKRYSDPASAYRITNDYCPILARLFALCNPDMAAYVRFNKSRYDGLVIDSTPEEWGLANG